MRPTHASISGRAAVLRPPEYGVHNLSVRCDGAVSQAIDGYTGQRGRVSTVWAAATL